MHTPRRRACASRLGLSGRASGGGRPRGRRAPAAHGRGRRGRQEQRRRHCADAGDVRAEGARGPLSDRERRAARALGGARLCRSGRRDRARRCPPRGFARCVERRPSRPNRAGSTAAGITAAARPAGQSGRCPATPPPPAESPVPAADALRGLALARARSLPLTACARACHSSQLPPHRSDGWAGSGGAPYRAPPTPPRARRRSTSASCRSVCFGEGEENRPAPSAGTAACLCGHPARPARPPPRLAQACPADASDWIGSRPPPSQRSA